MVIKTIEVRDLPEYKEIIKKTAFNQAKDIVKGVWPELADNMTIYVPNSQEDTERVSANQRPPEAMSTGEDQIRRLREDITQHLNENIAQGTLDVLTSISNSDIRTIYRENNNITDTVMCLDRNHDRPSAHTGSMFFDTRTNELNIFSGRVWFTIPAYRRPEYTMEFTSSN